MSTPAKRSGAQEPVHPQRLVAQMGAEIAAERRATPRAPEQRQYRPLHQQEYPTSRPDMMRKPEMVKRGRRAHLPATYGIWWLATLVLFLLGAGLGAHHGLEYFGYELWSLTTSDLQETRVFMVLSASLLCSLFFVWILQNMAKGLTHQKPNPAGSYNNMYGVLVCLSIVVGMKFASDVVSNKALAADLADLAWLRGEEPAESDGAPVKTTAPAAGSSGSSGESTTEPTASTPEARPEPAPVSPFRKPKPETVVSLSGSKPAGGGVSSQPSQAGVNNAEVRVGDPTKSVMADAIRSFQSAAGRVRTAERAVSRTPRPDLSNVATAGPIEAVAAVHREAFEAHRALSRLASDLPNSTRISMLQAGASVGQTDEQVASLESLLNLKPAATLHDAEASLHAARAAYAAFLSEHFGGWRVVNGVVRFEDDEAGATASQLQATIGERERDLQDAKMSMFGG
ncbi:MAG: hypothetical protein ACF8Q5_01440 [Phycisphaerales bacterium JB040]